MPLIPCPVCSHRISDAAVSCPSCGHPMARSPGEARAGSGSDPGRAKVLALLRSQGKIAAIKELRDQQPALGLKGAKEEVERMEAALPPSERRKEAGCLGLVLLCSGAVLVLGGGVAVAVGLW